MCESFRLFYERFRLLLLGIRFLTFKREFVNYMLGLSMITVISGTSMYSPFLLFHL